MAEIPNHDFVTELRNGLEVVVPSSLSRDAVPKPLCQRCYREMDNVSLLSFVENIENEIVSVFIEGRGSQSTEQIERSWPPSAERLRDERRREFGDLTEFAETQENVDVEDGGILGNSGRDEVPTVVPGSMRNGVLRWVHGSRLCVYYDMQRTMTKLLPRYYWKKMARQTKQSSSNCLWSTVSQDRNSRSQGSLEIVHSGRRFQQVVFGARITTPKTKNRNLRVFAILGVFS